MPDLTSFSITPLASAPVTVPRATISGKVINPITKAVLADFTGANALTFPNVLGSLTAAERLELVEMIAHWLVQKRFPGAWG